MGFGGPAVTRGQLKHLLDMGELTHVGVRVIPFGTDSSNCVYVAATPTGTVRLRESDEPETILTTRPAALSSLIRILKTSADPR